MKKISLIGCGRWGTFLGWYAAPSLMIPFDFDTVVFNEDGTLEGSLGTQRFTGKWSADPKDRSVSFTQLSPSSDNLSGMSKEFIQRLENARYYRGDSKTLQLAPESRTSCIQLTTKHDN